MGRDVKVGKGLQFHYDEALNTEAIRDAGMTSVNILSWTQPDP